MINVSEFVSAVEGWLDDSGEARVFRSMARDAKEGRMSFDDVSPHRWRHRNQPDTG